MKKAVFIALIMALSIISIPIEADKNSPPSKPVVNGPTEGEIGKSYTYTAVSTDPDGDRIYYCFDWGDGNEFCTSLYPSGETVEASHTWQEEGTYKIKVVATDENGAESEPAYLTVKMPLSFSQIKIVKPRKGLYLFGIKVLPMPGIIVIGDITVRVRATNNINKVEFLLPMACHCGMEVMHTDTSAPFEWIWNRDYNDEEIKDEGFTELVVKGYDEQLNIYRDSIILYKVKL